MLLSCSQFEICYLRQVYCDTAFTHILKFLVITLKKKKRTQIILLSWSLRQSKTPSIYKRNHLSFPIKDTVILPSHKPVNLFPLRIQQSTSNPTGQGIEQSMTLWLIFTISWSFASYHLRANESDPNKEKSMKTYKVQGSHHKPAG